MITLFSNITNRIQYLGAERLYQIEHPRLVNQFDEIFEPGLDDIGYWISKSWLKGSLILTKYTISAHHVYETGDWLNLKCMWWLKAIQDLIPLGMRITFVAFMTGYHSIQLLDAVYLWR